MGHPLTDQGRAKVTQPEGYRVLPLDPLMPLVRAFVGGGLLPFETHSPLKKKKPLVWAYLQLLL